MRAVKSLPSLPDDGLRFRDVVALLVGCRISVRIGNQGKALEGLALQLAIVLVFSRIRHFPACTHQDRCDMA